ncbi:MAG TPA: hypothetical protein VH475_21740 [Tepidisphaeraceae bacterium]|jgi:hypothetical protein
MKKFVLRAATLVCLLVCVVAVYLWIAQPGELYSTYTHHHEYHLTATNGRLFWTIADRVWPPGSDPAGRSVAGFRIVRLPLWPVVLLTAIPPLVWVIRRRRALSQDGDGFPSQAP